LVGLITNCNESHYRENLDTFAETCQADDLDLNVSKTKEMIIDFRKVAEPPMEPVMKENSLVDIVPQYDYLGSRI
jgi:hypothetical protein